MKNAKFLNKFYNIRFNKSLIFIRFSKYILFIIIHKFIYNTKINFINKKKFFSYSFNGKNKITY